MKADVGIFRSRSSIGKSRWLITRRLSVQVRSGPRYFWGIIYSFVIRFLEFRFCLIPLSVRIRVYAPIVQWIEHVGPNDEISVRFRIGVHGVFLNIFP